MRVIRESVRTSNCVVLSRTCDLSGAWLKPDIQTLQRGLAGPSALAAER